MMLWRGRGVRLVFVTLAACVAAGALAAHLSASASFTIYSGADGTLVDGGIYGPFDGVADDWDWTFNQSGYEGAITLSTGGEASSFEHRLVFEYDLTGVNVSPPVQARLYFTLRGAPVWPFPDTWVHVYAYSANLAEDVSDYSATPEVFQGRIRLQSFQPSTQFSIDVSDLVNAIAPGAGGARRVAFRFQIDPGTEETSNQAFMDADDDFPESKPYLVVFQGRRRPERTSIR